MENLKNIKCPVCGKYIFKEENDFDICDVCGWENDGIQYRDRNFAGGANELCVNEARIEYFLLNFAPTASDAAHIRQNYKNKKNKISEKYRGCEDQNAILEEYSAAHQKYLDILNELFNKIIDRQS